MFTGDTFVAEQAITIHQFLEQAGFECRIADIGRRIQSLSSSQFQQIEDTTAPYPWPYLQHAWLALILWPKGPKPQALEGYSVWFLRFPLDEQGKLNQVARDEFLQQVLAKIGENLDAQQQGEKLQAVLEGNPYAFTPAQGTQAAYNGIIKVRLGLPASDYLAPVVRYCQQPDDQQWQALGIQGFADLAARWDKADHKPLLQAAILELPEAPLLPLLEALEHQPVDHYLVQAIQQRLQHNSDQPALYCAALRAMASSPATGMRQQQITAALEQLQQAPFTEASANLELLVTVAIRCWQDLQEPALCQAFLEALAAHANQQQFTRIMGDLLTIPGMRAPLLTQLRNPERSEALAQAIGTLFGQLQR